MQIRSSRLILLLLVGFIVAGLWIPFQPTLLHSHSEPSGSAAVQESSEPSPSDLEQAQEEAVAEEDDESVDLAIELATLQELFQRRMALLYLKHQHDEGSIDQLVQGLDPQSAEDIKSHVEDESRYKQLNYHYVERTRNSELRLLEKLRADKFEGLQDVLDFMESTQYPESVAFANLMNVLEINFVYGRRQSLITDESLVKEVAARLNAETNRIQSTTGHEDLEVAQAMWQDPSGFPAWWFDPSSGPQTYEFKTIPATEDFPRIDLNTATAQQLADVPHLQKEVVQDILKYRTKNGWFQGPEELRLVKSVPRHLVFPLQTLTVASHQPQKKKWTVLVFLNGANNLEPAGIEDINEMETIGSTRDVNVVVELARMEGQDDEPAPNSDYFVNPYRERKSQYYHGLGNVPGAQRYYILEDDDDMRVNSVIKEHVPNADAGSPQSLIDFGTWAIKHYPAEHYALVIWNHGSGWTGASHDENTENELDLPEIRTALEGICEFLQEEQGKEKIDVVDFDACLMATFEVACELHETVDFLLASQELEPGDGMPYDECLKWLAMFPEASPLSFCKAMVDRYVHSYAPGGTQAPGGQSGFSETKSAIRMSRVPQMREALEQFAQLLKQRPDLIGEVADEVVNDSRAYMDRMVDIQDFVEKFSKRRPDDAELKAAAQKIKDLIGYSKDDYPLVNEVIVRRRSPGNVIWGYNGWKSPPRDLAPFVHESKHAKTPLIGPDERGYYSAKISFPPVIFPGGGGGFGPFMNSRQDLEDLLESMDESELPDGAMATEGKQEEDGPQVVKEINYRFEDDMKEHKFTDFENLFVTTDFPDDSLMVAEGHLINNNHSHGLSIYFPSYLGYNKEYRRLRFAQDSTWVQLCETFPLRELSDIQPIALLGLSHQSKADREELASIVSKEEYERTIRKVNFAQTYQQDLDSLQKPYNTIRDPRLYGEDWHGLLEHWYGGTIIVDNTDGLDTQSSPFQHLASGPSMFGFSPTASAPSARGPDGRTLMRFTGQGGSLLLCTPQVANNLWDLPFYRDTLGLQYDQVWDQSFEFQLAGSEAEAGLTLEIKKSTKTAKIVTFQGAEGVQPWCVLTDTGKMIGAKIERVHPKSGKKFRAVVLGFYLNDIADEQQRQMLLDDALTFLSGHRNSPSQDPTKSGITTTGTEPSEADTDAKESTDSKSDTSRKGQ